MKASRTFINLLVEGIKACRAAHGAACLDNMHPARIYFLVHAAITPGFEHNAKFTMAQNSSLHDEAKDLTDDNIAAAVRAALRV